MEKSKKIWIASLVALILVIGIVSATAISYSSQDKDIKKTMKKINESIISLRLGKDASESLEGVKNSYKNLTSGENFQNRPELEELDIKISDVFKNQKDADLEDVKYLRDKVSKMAKEIDTGIPPIYSNASMIILGSSILLSFLGTALSRNLVNWEKLREAQEKIREWRGKINKKQQKKGKTRRKSEALDENLKENREKIWEINIQQAVFYIGLFLLALGWFSFVYDDWIAVWLPFTWFSSGNLSQIGVSLGVLGWFFLCFFGFALIWRYLLIPKE